MTENKNTDMGKGAARRAMTVAYEVDGALYLNLTNRCNNNCVFCIRKNGDGAYGSDSLWLIREPTLDEAMSELFSRSLDTYSELVFCGYGEPAMRLDDCISLARAVKARYPSLKIRINTNGTADIIHGRDTSSDFSVFDTVSISLNAPTSARYDEISHPVLNFSPFSAILTFAENVNKCVHNTIFTVVGDFLSCDELAACQALADKMGIPLRVRDYIAE